MRPDRALATTLRASALYDWTAFVLLIWMPAWLFDLFGHARPLEPFLFRLAALPLLLLPLVYFAAARDGLGHPELVRVCVRLRLLGALAIAVLLVWQQPAPSSPYWIFAAMDALWAAAYVLAALPAGLRLFGD
jgi:hypothetical protein